MPGLKPVNDTWDSYLGCPGGCVKYFGRELPRSTLYGLSGHAFGINIHKELCPSGPHVWEQWGLLRGQERALGLNIERLGPWYKGYDVKYEEHRREIWDRVKAALDAG